MHIRRNKKRLKNFPNSRNNFINIKKNTPHGSKKQQLLKQNHHYIYLQHVILKLKTM